MTDTYSSMYGFSDFDEPAPWETPEQRKLRLEKQLADAIAEEETYTGQRSQMRDMAIPDDLPAPEDQIGDFIGANAKELYKTTGGLRYGLTGFLASVARTPWDVASAAVRNAPEDVLADPGVDPLRRTNIANWLSDQATGAENLIRGGTGAQATPSTVVEEQAVNLGAAFNPAKKLTVPLTTANYLFNLFNRQPYEDLAGVTADETQRVGQQPVPIKPPGSLGPDWLSTVLDPGTYSFVSSAEAAPRERKKKEQPDIPVPSVMIETQGGPQNVSWKDYSILGGLAMASMGMMFGPKVWRNFKFGSVPTLRPVTDAVPGTSAISTLGDLARTQDDVDAGLMRIAERGGVSVAAVNDLKDVWRIQTRGNAETIGNSAVIGGRAETPSYTFSTPVPLIDIARTETDDITRYFQLRNTFDEINLVDARIAAGKVKNPPPGPTTVRGQNMQDVLREMTMIEQANPQARRIAQAYQQNLRDLRKFESTGEYSTLTRKQASWENTNRPNDTQFTRNDVLDELTTDGRVVENTADQLRRRVKARIENEAKGLYIDAVRKQNPSLFMSVNDYAKQRGMTVGEVLRRNPSWNKNKVSFYRRGKLETYTTDPFIADVMKLDPYYMSGSAAQALYGSKRLLEMGATGALAPWFAITSFLRSHQINKLTAPDAFRGARSAGIVRSLAAIPQQLYPELANVISTSLARGSAGWLGRTFGQGNVQGLATRLAQVYDNSLLAQLKSVGSTQGNVMTQQAIAASQLRRAIDAATGPGKAMLKGYMNLLQAVHNAPAFAFASKNYGKVSLSKLAQEARHLTGSPRVGGQYYTGGPGTRPIRFVNEDAGIVSHTLEQVIRGYGRTAEAGREVLPWYNVATQGIKRIGEAYLKNPVGFTGRTWLYTMMPAAAGYLYVYSLGNDPNGVPYRRYMMEGRNDYKKTMNYYIPIKDRPAEEGIEFPRFHELAPAARLMEAALDHIMSSTIFREEEDVARAAQSFFDIALTPPAPPLFGALLATHGLTAPQGIFGGEVYKRRSEAFDQTGGLPTNIELLVRSLSGGIGDVVGAGAAAYTQTPKELSQFDAMWNGLKESGKRAVSKAPLLRDALGIYPPAAGNTPITEELFKKQRALGMLESYYKKYGLLAPESGLIGAKEASKQGEQIATKLLGPRPPTQSAGINQPKPENPLYQMFAEEVHNKFKKDAPLDEKGQPTGAIGFRSIWNRYSVATQQIQRINKINTGNYVTWDWQMENRPEMKVYLAKNGVDYDDPIRVKNFFERQRQDAARVLLHTIRNVEDEFSKRLGRPIKIEDLNPYGKGLGEEDQGVMQFDLGGASDY